MRPRALELLDGVTVPAGEVEVEVSRAAGPGGQHVNRTETKVTLRFDLAGSPSLPEASRERMRRRLAHRLTRAGEILVSCQRHRDRGSNLREAWERLERLLREAMRRPRPRRRTRPTAGSIERRLETKRRRAQAKRRRRAPQREE